MSPKCSLKLVPGNLSILRQSGSMMTSLNACRPLQLMWCVFYLQVLQDPKEMELLFNCIQPFIYLQWFLCFLKGRRLGVKKVLKIVELVRFRSLMLVPSSSMAGILRKTAQHFSHGTLGFHELGHHLRWRGMRWWWEVLIVIATRTTTTRIISTSSPMSARHLQNFNQSNYWWCQKNCRGII